MSSFFLINLFILGVFSFGWRNNIFPSCIWV
uniref:Uncharacterized protein n=1 Tax=Arundo donax TaxID=35708 RepID=A0A0A9FWG3_ARUDO